MEARWLRPFVAQNAPQDFRRLEEAKQTENLTRSVPQGRSRNGFEEIALPCRKCLPID